MLANVQRLAHRGLAAARGRAASEDEDRTPRYAARAADGGDADPVARRGQVWASRPRTGPLVIDLDLFQGARRLPAATASARSPTIDRSTRPGGTTARSHCWRTRRTHRRPRLHWSGSRRPPRT